MTAIMESERKRPFVRTNAASAMQVAPLPIAVDDDLARILLGELYLLRRKLGDTLDRVSALLRERPGGDRWEDVERAARIAYRGLSCAVAGVPAPAPLSPQAGEIAVGALRIDLALGRQWWGAVEVELTPLLHRLLIRLAREPRRFFGRDELLRDVWRLDEPRCEADCGASCLDAAAQGARSKWCAAGWRRCWATACRLGTPRSGGGLMDAMFDAYLDTLRRRRRAAATIRNAESVLNGLEQWLIDADLNAITFSPIACEQFFDQQLNRYALSTVHHRLTTVRAAYRYGQRHQLVDHDPTVDLQLPKQPEHEPLTYSNDELKAIHAATRTSREELLFYLFAFTGLRLSEARSLHWDQINLERKQLSVVGKGSRLRLVPLHPSLEGVLRVRQDATRSAYLFPGRLDRPLAANTLASTLANLVSRAGLTGHATCSHTFRRTVASELYEQGIRRRVIEKIMGWAARTVPDRHYIRIADQTLHQAIRTLYQNDPICQPPPAPTVSPTLTKQRDHPFALDLAQLETLECKYGVVPN
ncbi:MAG: tyrosine-type recombinase/integrase [Mycobacteriales bacterium]